MVRRITDFAVILFQELLKKENILIIRRPKRSHLRQGTVDCGTSVAYVEFVLSNQTL